MAEVESKVIITAQNNTGSAFSSMTGGLDGMIGKLGGVALAAGAVAGVVAGARWLSDITAKSIEAAGHLWRKRSPAWRTAPARRPWLLMCSANPAPCCCRS